MEEILKIAATIIASVGGGGAIIWFFSSLIGKLWADRLLQKKSHQFEKELESYKTDLSLVTEKYKTEAEKLTYISKIQFETEYNIYQEIFEALFDFTDSSSRLFPRFDSIPIDPEEQQKEYERRYKFYCESFNKYSKIVEINAPFIPEEIYDRFIELRKQAQSIACLYPDIKIKPDESFKKDYQEIESTNRIETEDLLIKIKQVKKDVRNYLSSMKVSNDSENN